KKTQTEAAVLLGVQAPTGVTNRVDNQGQLFDAEFQPGTGAWNALFGAAVTKRFGSWSFDSNVLYILSSTGTQDTDLGDRFLYNPAPAYRLTGNVSGKSEHGHMHLGADFPEPMFHGGPKANAATATRSHQEPAATPSTNLDLVLEINGEWHD